MKYIKELKYNCFLNVKRFKMLGKDRYKIFLFGKIICFDFKLYGVIN